MGGWSETWPRLLSFVNVERLLSFKIKQARFDVLS